MAELGGDRIRELFNEEAEVRLAQLTQSLLQLEQHTDDLTLVGAIFREVHTLKGSSAVAGLHQISCVAHELEELVDDLRTRRISATPEVIDKLLAGADKLAEMISSPAHTSDPMPSFAQGTAPTAQLKEHGQAPAQEWTSAPRAEAEETSPALVEPPTAGEPSRRTDEISDPASVADFVRSRPAQEQMSGHRSSDQLRPGGDRVVLVPIERLDELVRLLGESVSAHLRMGRMLKDRFGVDPASCIEFNELSRSINDLQDRTMRTRMVAVATITDKLHRAVRDLARSQGKEIRWGVRGTDTEIDRGVLNQLSDSLLHLVRNAVDHGIEAPTQRAAIGKPTQGIIQLHAMQIGSEVIIAVTDDGHGIDLQHVQREAARQGIDTESMSDDEVLELIFRSGLSTTSFVTDVSGRGVGLDAVRANVEAAHGRVEVRSQVAVGTEFRIIVPITLAVLRCLLVEAGGQRFALPFHRVVMSHPYEPASQLQAEGRPVVWLDGQPIRVSDLAQTLALADTNATSGPIVVLSDTAHRHAFRVDRLVGQRDVALKGLSRLLPHIAAVAGASVEPDGSVLLVLDPPGLIRRARQTGGVVAPFEAATQPDAPQYRVLIVDDALTVRELQRSILERAGFKVGVAIDGNQALARLADERSDLVLTDIEMPNMDGFELTEAIRAHPALKNIPVLIVSSRSDDADRQRGLDAGADGYIVKSGFDESRLLSAVNRLLGVRT